MTEYLELEDVLAYIVDRGLVLRDPGLLSSALARPQTSLFGADAYPTLAEKAAALLHSVAQNQCLVDGNKRLALLCAHVSLGLNGHRLGMTDDDAFDLLGRQIPSGLHDVGRIAVLLHVKPR